MVQSSNKRNLMNLLESVITLKELKEPSKSKNSVKSDQAKTLLNFSVKEADHHIRNHSSGERNVA